MHEGNRQGKEGGDIPDLTVIVPACNEALIIEQVVSSLITVLKNLDLSSEVLVIEAANLVGRMELVIDKDKKDDIKKALSPHLTEEEIPPAYFDKAANWFAQKLPGNK